jgi:hypothetical protein
VAESCTICSSRSRRSARKLLDTPSYAYSRPKQKLKFKEANKDYNYSTIPKRICKTGSGSFKV